MNLTVFPFDKNTAPIVRFRDMIPAQVFPVAPRGWGYGGEDTSACDGGQPTGVLVETEFEKCLAQSDAVLMDKALMPLEPPAYLEKLALVRESGKRLLLTKPLADFLYGGKVPEGMELMGNPSVQADIASDKLYTIPVPVIFIMGAGAYCNKFELQLGLRRLALEQGYRVTQIGTKEYSSLFGFDPVPRQLFGPMPTREKILFFNHYVYEKARREKAGLVIIGVHGGIMPVNPYHFEDFGELMQIIAHGVTADSAVLSIYAQQVLPEFFTELKNLAKYRFGIPLGHFNYANTDLLISAERTETRYMTVSSDYIMENLIQNGDFPDANVFTALRDDNRDIGLEKVLNSLAAVV